MRLKQTTGICGVYLLAAIRVWVPASVRAEMLGTPQAMQSLSDPASEREQLISMVQRTEVQEHLQAFGVSGTEALNRVNSMTDDEVALGHSANRPASRGTGGGRIGCCYIIDFFLCGHCGLVDRTHKNRESRIGGSSRQLDL